MPISSTAKSLQKKLGEALPRESKRSIAKPSVFESSAGTPLRAPKLSVSIYQRDLQRIDEIKEFMRSRGVRNLSDSEALRLACRCVEIGDGLVSAYRDMQGEDGRRR